MQEIVLFRGDDTGGDFGRTVTIVINAESGVSLSGCSARLVFDGIEKDISAPLVSGETRIINYSHAETAAMALGVRFASLQLIDSAGRVRTLDNLVRVRVTDTLSECYPGASSVSGAVVLSIPWSAITSKPTTLAGYGITDAATSEQLAAKQDELSAEQLAAVNSGITADKLAALGTAAGDIPNKADKVSSATAGHLASLDASGNLVDSGKAPADFAAAADLPYALVEIPASGQLADRAENYATEEFVHNWVWADSTGASDWNLSTPMPAPVLIEGSTYRLPAEWRANGGFFGFTLPASVTGTLDTGGSTSPDAQGFIPFELNAAEVPVKVVITSTDGSTSYGNIYDASDVNLDHPVVSGAQFEDYGSLWLCGFSFDGDGAMPTALSCQVGISSGAVGTYDATVTMTGDLYVFRNRDSPPHYAIPTLTLPPAIPGRVRDLLVRLEVSEVVAGAGYDISFAAPTGETIKYESEDGDFPAFEAGANLYSFTEMPGGKFAVSHKMLKEVS